jgi:hypothetical protein
MAMPPDKFRSQIADAKKRLQQVLGEQRKINEEISYLRDLIRANANFLPDSEKEQEFYFLEIFQHPTNITQAVRLALSIAAIGKNKLTPLAIKDVIERIGFDFSEYSNPMASIHTILKRMKESEPPEAKHDEENGLYWFDNISEDVISPTTIKNIFDKTLDELVTTGDREKVLATATKVTQEMIRKVGSMAKRRKDD